MLIRAPAGKPILSESRLGGTREQGPNSECRRDSGALAGNSQRTDDTDGSLCISHFYPTATLTNLDDSRREELL